MTFLIRQAFSKMFKKSAEDLDMHGTTDAVAGTQLLHNSSLYMHSRPNCRSCDCFAIAFCHSNQMSNLSTESVIYDVSHNIAKIEQHVVGGKVKQLLVCKQAKV